jgi:hypothetical protein
VLLQQRVDQIVALRLLLLFGHFASISGYDPHTNFLIPSTLLDEHTRQCLAIHPAWSIRAVDVITVVEAAIARYGVPEHLRSDNGPEFIAYCI